MAEKLESQTTNWDSVFGGMKQYLAAIPMPAEFYREGVLKLQAYMLEHHADELRAECEKLKKDLAEKGFDFSDSKIVIEALLELASTDRHDVPLEFNPDLVIARAK